MKKNKLGKIITQNLRRNRKNIVFSSIGIVVGISSFVFFIALGTGIQRLVAEEIFPVEANRLNVVPRTAQFGSLSTGGIINDEALEKLKGIPGVANVFPRMPFQFLATCSLDGRDISPGTLDLLSKLPGIDRRKLQAVSDVRMWLEVMGNGIDPRLVQPDLTVMDFSHPAPGEPIPVLLSRSMVEIYNSSFAKIRSLPRINSMLIPFLPPIPLTLNHSYISRDVAGPALNTKLKIVGLSHYALMGGITVPLETARIFNKQLVGGKAADSYDLAIVEVGSSRHLGAVQQKIQELGFELDLSQKQRAESIGLTITLITLGFSLISLLIVGIAAINIAHTFFMIIYERKREIGLMRALGATRADIRSLVLGEAAFVGLLGGGMGVLVGFLAGLLVDLVVVNLLPDFPFKPDRFFVYSIWLILGALGCSIVFCVLGAFFPAHKAAKLDPATCLTGR